MFSYPFYPLPAINWNILYIMNLDGNHLFQLSSQLFIGTVNWSP